MNTHEYMYDNMYDKIDVKNLALKRGDILFETFMVNNDFFDIINTCMTSTSFMFNVYKYNNEDITSTCEAYINHYLEQKHQDIFLAEVYKDKQKEFRILNNRYYVLVLEAEGVFVETVKFSDKGESPKTTTWNVNNDYFRDSKYFQMRYIKKMYNFQEVQDIWIQWVRENFRDIIDGKIGGINNLLF